MNKLISFLLISVLAISITSCESNDSPLVVSPSNLTATNKVLIELFTNTSCIPCVQTNIFLDNINDLEGVTINDTNVIIIRYHTALYPNDPFYLYNVPGNDARISYYNAASSNPRGYLRGTFMGLYNSATWTNLINERLATTSSFAINATNNFNASNRTGTLNVTVGQLAGNTENNLVLHAALIEDSIAFNGQNGETLFENVLRNFITPAAGEPFSISSGQSANFVLNYSVNNIIDLQHARFILFVQNVSTKEVFVVEKYSVD
jgi:hypothetical protein